MYNCSVTDIYGLTFQIRKAVTQVTVYESKVTLSVKNIVNE